MEKIQIACLVFEAIKQNWNKGGSFRSLVEIICQRLDVPFDEQIYELLKKADALWLNNHLEDSGEDMPEEETEPTQVKERVAKVVQAHADKKNHDFH